MNRLPCSGCNPARSSTALTLPIASLHMHDFCLFAGPQLDLPHDVTPKQLETLLNGLLKQEEKLPYSFFVNEQQLSQELGAHLLQHKVRAHCFSALVSQRSFPICCLS